MYFKDYSIDKFLYELKTDLPSPGGGSTAALVSALAGVLQGPKHYRNLGTRFR